MRGLHMAPQTLLVRELLLVLAVLHETGERPQLHALDLRRSIRVVNRLISSIIVTLMPHIVVELLPRQLRVLRDDDLFQLSLAECAIFVVH